MAKKSGKSAKINTGKLDKLTDRQIVLLDILPAETREKIMMANAAIIEAKAMSRGPGRPRKHDGESPRDRLDIAKAEAQETENKIAKGRLIERDTILRSANTQSQKARSDLTNLGNSMAPQLEGKSSRDIKAMLDAWAEERLIEWADWAESVIRKSKK